MMLMPSIQLTLLLLVFLISAPQRSFSLTGCELCASSGDCSGAYLQQPGKYCGTFQQYVTTKPCCCPDYSQCQLSSTSCNCYVPPSQGGKSHYRSHYSNYYSDYDGGAGGIVFMIIFICICCCCCASIRNSSPQHRGPSGEYVPIAVPLNGNNTSDPEGNPPATAPSYQASAPGFSSNFGGGGVRTSSGNGGGFSWAPALGGFILGEMLGRNEGGNRHHHHRHHRHHRGGGGGWGGGGGFTIPGDTGGGGGSGGGGGFTIPGSS